MKRRAWLVPGGAMSWIPLGPRYEDQGRSPSAVSEFARRVVPGWPASWWPGLGGWAALVPVVRDPWLATPKTRLGGGSAWEPVGAA